MARGSIGAMYRDSARNGKWMAEYMNSTNATGPRPFGMAGLCQSHPPMKTSTDIVIEIVNTMLNP
jgi:hypothetical protein